jgi:hypothetical protein
VTGQDEDKHAGQAIFQVSLFCHGFRVEPVGGVGVEQTLRAPVNWVADECVKLTPLEVDELIREHRARTRASGFLLSIPFDTAEPVACWLNGAKRVVDPDSAGFARIIALALAKRLKDAP